MSNYIEERRLESGKKYFTSRFRADIYEIKLVISDALAYYDRAFGIMDDDTRLEMKIVLNELLINAIKHSGNADSSNYINAIAGMASEDCAFLIIEDDGEGYDTARINNDRHVKNYSGRIDDIEETGRGIYIVKNLCEDFMVNEKGNKVVVIKKLQKMAM